MASTSTTEATEVRRRGRQRLIGAIALVAVLVVFVPMILDSEPRPKGETPTLAIPPKDNAPPLPAPSKATPAPAETAKPAEAPQPVTVAKTDAKVAEAKVLEPSKPPAPKAAPPAAAVTPAPSATPAPSVTPAKTGAQSPAAPKLEGFAVQVGAFRDEAKLEQARQKLSAAKIPHYTERLEAKAGPLTRLRAGPFPTREAAESALASLKRSALDGKVVALP